MARLLFALPRFHTNLWFATRAMREAGHELCYLVNQVADGEDHTFIEPVCMGRYPSRAEVETAVEAFGPDLVIVRNAWAVSRRVARAARRHRLPCILYNQIPDTTPTSVFRRMELAWKGLPAARITPVTPVRGEGHDAPRDPFATYLPWPVAALHAPEPAPRREGVLNLLCVGKLGQPRKNQIHLVDLIERAGLDTRVHLTLAGVGGGDSAYRSKVEALGRKPWISMIGTVAFRDMANLYTSADACILPSFGEPLGSSPVEAMAYGVVPLISAECGSAGYVTPEQDGFVIDMHYPESVAATLRLLCDDPELLARMKTEAKRTAETDLSEARFIDRLRAVLAAQGVA